ncbi:MULTISPECIES: VasL domain-containing protein [unclassified Symbiopectobacterium]|uniref:VasL domain-containing protein n=1 Tax=unclassified Symbiopectobacterium TaxID=2794573 RepID=UPI002225BD54|nr:MULTISPECIES: VasL domain-containing protein [unclassified Symbiopectobacterium]MCW2473239.1 type VI secretion system ImpA family N-terminal domain-containing protein [Candidatus Symbiopectobacterium sp. NZEC151]MCW2482150.1 type VI secretion system ImpA family N-terminal domain-containing protein [Candidatus Symbiopectobacterium sp. NZEC135]
MQDAQQALNVGRDPRMLPEFDALRAEINKLSHASRPDVDWMRVHDMATTLFEKQGVDLQTALYFALARSRLAGLSGFTESCEFLANLIVTQWDNFWPPVHQERARVEMLDWFIARISEVIRQYDISHEDKRLVYRCERALQLMSEKLHNVGLSRIPRVENLLHFIEGYTHLFDESEIVIVSDDPALNKHDMQVPPMVFFHSEMEAVTADPSGVVTRDGKAPLPTGSILIGREKGQMKPTVLKIETHKKPTPAWLWFAAGVLSCALPVAAFSVWQYVQEQKAQALALVQQSASALPSAPDYNAIRSVRIALGEQKLQSMEGTLIGHYQTQLEQVKNTSPLYLYQYGDGLKNVMHQLYPDSLAVKEMERQWQRSLDQLQGEQPRITGYEQARANVDDTLQHLLELERQRRTVTLSFLKSKLYDLQKDLAADVPFTLRLRELEARNAKHQSLSPAELRGIEDELRAFSIRLYRLQQGDVAR